MKMDVTTANKLKEMYNQYVGSDDIKSRGVATGIMLAAEVLGIDVKEPIIDPVIKPGDVVRHKKDHNLVLGVVRRIAKNGLRAYVTWDQTDNPKLLWSVSAYYRLDLLEKVEG
jgi:hypothetical protein